MKLVTTVDQMSGGRIEVGVGAGWNDDDHEQLGLPFPSIGERADLMEDQLAILHGLWTRARWLDVRRAPVHVRNGALRPGAGRGRRAGRHEERPRPAPDHHGRPGLAARLPDRRAYADEFNLSSSTPDVARAKQPELDDGCRGGRT